MGMLKMMWAMVVGRLRGVPMVRCEEALENLFDFLDGELDERNRAAIEQHLDICKRCYPRAKFERAFLEALERVDEGKGVPDDLRQRVLASIEAEAG